MRRFCMLVLIAMNMIGCCKDKDGATNSAASGPPEVTVSAADLISEYKANEVAADTKEPLAKLKRVLRATCKTQKSPKQ